MQLSKSQPVQLSNHKCKVTNYFSQAKQIMQPNPNTREKAEGAKAYIEKKYAKLKDEEKEKKDGKLYRSNDFL